AAPHPLRRRDVSSRARDGDSAWSRGRTVPPLAAPNGGLPNAPAARVHFSLVSFARSLYIAWRESCIAPRSHRATVTTLAVIPARLGATRLHRKPLRLLGGSPLVVRVWQRVHDLGVADYCVIATDHEDVAAAARDAGAHCLLTAQTHPSGTDRVAEVSRAPSSPPDGSTSSSTCRAMNPSSPPKPSPARSKWSASAASRSVRSPSRTTLQSSTSPASSKWCVPTTGARCTFPGRQFHSHANAWPAMATARSTSRAE